MIESSNPIDDVNKWKKDGHSTSNESDSETFELDSINASITQTNQDDRPSNQNELLSSESESDLIEIDHRKSNFPKNLKKPFYAYEKGSTSNTEEIEEENVHTKEEGDWETSDKSKKVNQGTPITKKNEAGEQKVANSSHISDKNIPHQHSQARLRGAQPDIVDDKGWSCKPKTVKSNKKKERKQHKQPEKTEGTMKDLIDQDKPKSSIKSKRWLKLLACN
ncbi:unnamed protein product [Meloidogyne enterolobii]|uniref:Uncharacterized protein n=1 Tax=Meloidogyne enterolobii TaxID=390850 RepID=A0ACB0YYW0_MELEN